MDMYTHTIAIQAKAIEIHTKDMGIRTEFGGPSPENGKIPSPSPEKTVVISIPFLIEKMIFFINHGGVPTSLYCQDSKTPRQ